MVIFVPWLEKMVAKGPKTRNAFSINGLNRADGTTRITVAKTEAKDKARTKQSGLILFPIFYFFLLVV